MSGKSSAPLGEGNAVKLRICVSRYDFASNYKVLKVLRVLMVS